MQTYGYRITRPIGTGDERVWEEVDTGIWDVMPRHYCDPPTWDDVRRLTDDYNDKHNPGTYCSSFPVFLNEHGEWEKVAGSRSWGL